jgi:phosphoglycolate phosphatase-like HAD superfamily hydrolase
MQTGALTRWVLVMGMLCVVTAHADPLPSWNEGPVKQNIINFVTDVTNKASADYVAPDDRIAAFDNDGTLWVEQPIYTQAIYTLARIHAVAPQHPEWKTKEPFKTVLSGDLAAIAKMSMADFEMLIAVTHSGMTVEAFNDTVKDWLATAKNKHFNHLYTQLVYQPMLEAMKYLNDNNFTVYIVTGGGQEFVRAFSAKTYGIPVQRVIGSPVKTQYADNNHQPTLTKLPAVLYVNDGPGKPEGINLFIGKKPIIAFGNSDGDRQMLEWTQSGTGKRLMLLVHHDDATREYAYGPESKVGTFSTSLMQEAQAQKWQVISMKDDWKTIFAFDNTPAAAK